MDEFDQIARLFRPLSAGAPEALGLMDDAAVIASRPGHDLVITKDAMVEGVHFLSHDPPDRVARKLLRVNLSDLAAKAAEPFGYFLAVSWPHGYPDAAKAAFAAGLAQDQALYGLKLFGGDTVSTPGPLTLSATLLGWCAHGAMVRRSTARPGDVLLVSGVIGDGGLGLLAATGRLGGALQGELAVLERRYQLPEPRLSLRQTLRDFATAAADVSDGLLADAGHIAEAGATCARIQLERLPLSRAGASWLSAKPDELSGRLWLATAGDDYEVVCTTPPANAAAMIASAAAAGVALTPIGEIVEGSGVTALYGGEPVRVERTGWRHSEGA